MKKKSLLVLLGASLMLASCGGEGDTPTDSVSNDTTSQSADITTPDSNDPGTTTPDEPSVPELTKAEKVTALFARMATGASSTFVDPTACTTEYYGDNIGYLRLYTDDYINAGASNGGVAVVKNYGLFRYSYDTENKAIANSQVYSTNTSLTIADVAYTTKDLGVAADTVTFSESPRTHTFSTSDSDFCSITAALIGYGETVAQYPTKKVSFMISDDGESISNLTLALSGATDSATYKDVNETGIKIEKVGTTMNLDVEVFSKNHKPTAATAWGTAETQAFSKIYAGFTLPFPTGATWAVTESMPSATTFTYFDFKCGDKVSVYAAQLTASGFEYDAGNGVYVKTLAAATASVGQINEAVQISFTATAGTEYAAFYPDGIFAIKAFAYEVETFVTPVELNTTLSSKMSHSSASKSIYPTLDFGTDCTGIVLKDKTAEIQAKYPDDIQLFYGTIKAYYATEAQALAAVSSLITQFVNAGYSDYTSTYGSYYGLDGFVRKSDGTEYDDYDDYSYYAYSSTVYMYLERDDNDNYLGYVQIVMDHCGEYSYDY